MRRLLLVLSMVAIMAAMLVASAMPAFAFANPDSNGGRGEGQASAAGNCFLKVIPKQDEKDKPSNSHKTPGNAIETNCDHFWQLEI